MTAKELFEKYPLIFQVRKGRELEPFCMFGIECEVFMVKVSYEGKPYRKIMMNTWGAQACRHAKPQPL